MFDIANIGKTIKKNKIAKLLSISPEALEAFEKKYYEEVLSCEGLSENMFEINSRQMAETMNEKKIVTDSPILDDMKKRIVNELLNKTIAWDFDGKSASIRKNLVESITNPVTNKEIESLPLEIRPQLTGSLMKVDTHEPTYLILLDQYRNFLKETNPEKKRMYYQMFRRGLDILDLDPITREILATNKNSMGYWLPRMVTATLKSGTLRIPKTTIVKIPTTMLQLTRCEYQELTPTTMDIVNKYCMEAFNLDESKDYFIKTGTYSSKYDFRNARVHEPKEVRELGQYLLYIHYQALCMAHYDAKPSFYGVSTTDEWVVREYIEDKENNPTIYKGLPLHTEYRVFVDFDTREVIGISPYWEPNLMKNRFGNSSDSDSPHQVHDYIIFESYEKTLMKRYNDNKEKVLSYVIDILNNNDSMEGQWSIDIMQNGDEFYLIDMSLAENSALYDCVPKQLRRPTMENWIPKLQ